MCTVDIHTGGAADIGRAWSPPSRQAPLPNCSEREASKLSEGESEGSGLQLRPGALQ